MLIYIDITPTKEVVPIYTSRLDRIHKMKREVCEEFQLECSYIKVVFDGQELDQSLKFQDCNVENNNTVLLVQEKPKVDPSAVTVFVRNMTTGKSCQYKIALSCTIEDLKKQILDKEHIPVDEQRIMFAGKQLGAGNALADYKIQNDSTLLLTLSLKGGVMHRATYFTFTNVMEQRFIVYKPDPIAPDYRVYGPGVNTAADCENSKCRVFEEEFVCQHGFGLFRLNEEPSICPICKTASKETKTFSLSRARVLIRSSARVDNFVRSRCVEEVDGNDKELAQANESDMVEYEFVEIFSWELKEADMPLDDYSTCKTCCRKFKKNEVCHHGSLKAKTPFVKVRPHPYLNS